MRPWYSLVIAAIVVGFGCAAMDDMFEREQEVAASDVPQAARDAAAKAVAGIVLDDEVEVEEEDGRTVYEFEGAADGKTYEIEVTADGTVIEVEEDDD